MFCIRLTMNTGPNAAELQKADRVRMRCPAATPNKEIVGHAGIWIEVRDPKGEALYRRSVAAHAFDSTIEVRTGAADRPLERRKSERGSTLFHAVIPDLEAAGTFHVLERDGSTAADAAPKQHVRLDLRELKIRDLTRPSVDIPVS